jgi:hypothetical protein
MFTPHWELAASNFYFYCFCNVQIMRKVIFYWPSKVKFRFCLFR